MSAAEHHVLISDEADADGLWHLTCSCGWDQIASNEFDAELFASGHVGIHGSHAADSERCWCCGRAMTLDHSLCPPESDGVSPHNPPSLRHLARMLYAMREAG